MSFGTPQHAKVGLDEVVMPACKIALDDHIRCGERRASHGIERATTRQWIDRVAVDLVEAEATALASRPHVHKSFRDKLAPAHRWLVAQVGRPWSNVFSELSARFDTRTVARRHVVHDHMLHWVRRHDDLDQRHSRYDLVVDAYGILRKPRWFGFSYSKMRMLVAGWAAGRVCALTFRGWWWFRHAPVGAACINRYRCSHAKHYPIDGFEYHARTIVAARATTRGEVRHLDRLPAHLRAKLVIASLWR